MRGNKPFTVITYKKEEPKLHFKCPTHGCRLVEIPDKGLWCALGCGPTPPAIYTVDTYIEKERDKT